MTIGTGTANGNYTPGGGVGPTPPQIIVTTNVTVPIHDLVKINQNFQDLVRNTNNLTDVANVNIKDLQNAVTNLKNQVEGAQARSEANPTIDARTFNTIQRLLENISATGGNAEANNKLILEIKGAMNATAKKSKRKTKKKETEIRLKVGKPGFGATLFKKGVDFQVDNYGYARRGKSYLQEYLFPFDVTNVQGRQRKFLLFPNILGPVVLGVTEKQRWLNEYFLADVLGPDKRPVKEYPINTMDTVKFYVRIKFVRNGKRVPFPAKGDYFFGFLAISKESYKPGIVRMPVEKWYHDYPYASYLQYNVKVKEIKHIDLEEVKRYLGRDLQIEEQIIKTEERLVAEEIKRLNFIMNKMEEVYKQSLGIDVKQIFKTKKIEEEILRKLLEDSKEIHAVLSQFDADKILNQQKKKHEEIKKDIQKQLNELKAAKATSKEYKEEAQKHIEEQIKAREEALDRLEEWVGRINKRISQRSIMNAIEGVEKALKKDLSIRKKGEEAKPKLNELLEVLKNAYFELNRAYRNYQELENNQKFDIPDTFINVIKR